MGFRIPGYLRDSLYRRFNKTEFDESVLLTANPHARHHILMRQYQNMGYQ